MCNDKKYSQAFEILVITTFFVFMGCSDAKFQGNNDYSKVKNIEDYDQEAEKDAIKIYPEVPKGNEIDPLPVEPPPVEPPPVEPPPVEPPPVEPPPVEPVYLYKKFTQGKIEDISTQVPASSLLPLDIVLVVDNSVSMTAEQSIMQDFLPLILGSIGDFDWQIGLTTTDVKGKDGLRDSGDECLHELIKKGEMNIDSRFASAVNVGTAGAATERGLYMAAKSLLNNCSVKNYAPNGPWIRPNSAIAIIIVSDERNCQNSGSTNGKCLATDSEVNKDLIDNKMIANSDGYLLLMDQLKIQRQATNNQLIKNYGFLNPSQNLGYIDVMNAEDWFPLVSNADVNSPEYLVLKAQFQEFAGKVGKSIKDQVTTSHKIDNKVIPESLEILAEGVQKLEVNQYTYDPVSYEVVINYDIMVNDHIAQYYQIKYQIKLNEIVSKVTLDVLPKPGSVSVKAVNQQGIEVDFADTTFTIVDKDVIFDPAPEYEDVVTIKYEAL